MAPGAPVRNIIAAMLGHVLKSTTSRSLPPCSGIRAARLARPSAGKHREQACPPPSGECQRSCRPDDAVALRIEGDDADRCPVAGGSAPAPWIAGPRGLVKRVAGTQQTTVLARPCAASSAHTARRPAATVSNLQSFARTDGHSHCPRCPGNTAGARPPRRVPRSPHRPGESRRLPPR